MSDLNHTQLIAAVAQESGHSQAAVAAVLRATFDVVGRTVAGGGTVSVTNFGRFDRLVRKSAHNPQTMEPLGPTAGVRFKSSGRLREAVREGQQITTLKKNHSR
jgi:DNA-binding protein HU-beta